MNPPKPLKPLSTFATDKQLTCARFNADGTLLAAGCIDATVRLWRVGEKELTALPNVEGHYGWSTSIAFHPGENLLFSADSWGRLQCSRIAGDGTAKTVWHHEQAHDGWVRQIALAPDGRTLATCGRDQTLRLWSAEGEKLAEHRHDDDVFALTFTPGGKAVVFGDHHGHLVLWNTADKSVGAKFDATVLFKTDRIQDISGLRVLTFADGGKTLIAAGAIPDKGATIQSTPVALAFDFQTQKLAHKFTHGALKDGFIEDLVVHPSGFVMGVTSGDPGNGKLLLFRLGEKEAFDSATALPNCQAIALHPDGKRFAIASTNRDSNGNGRRTAKDGSYFQNSSPVHLFELPQVS